MKSRKILRGKRTKPAARLRNAIKNDPRLAAESSRLIGADLTDPVVIVAFLLHYSLQNNPEGVVLFSTTNLCHLEANVKQAGTECFDDAQLKYFVTLVDQLSGLQDAATARAEGVA